MRKIKDVRRVLLREEIVWVKSLEVSKHGVFKEKKIVSRSKESNGRQGVGVL